MDKHLFLQTLKAFYIENKEIQYFSENRWIPMYPEGNNTFNPDRYEYRIAPIQPLNPNHYKQIKYKHKLNSKIMITSQCFCTYKEFFDTYILSPNELEFYFFIP